MLKAALTAVVLFSVRLVGIIYSRLVFTTVLQYFIVV